MSTLATPGGLDKTTAFYNSVIGKKVVMAVTGLVLFGFVLGHMVGNLQVFLPAREGVPVLDLYGEKLRALPPLLWSVRLVLLVAVILHIVAAIQLALLNIREARPVGYVKKAAISSSYASRTMVWSGPIIGLYVIYHLLHLTIGTVHSQFQEGKVYHNLVTGLQNPVIAFAYLIANVMLAIHLYHGGWSMFQSLGVAHPRYTPWLKRASAALAILIGAGFCSIPLAILTGIVKP
jgi:succinate dehydrogenase / fumarate reductase, cytochrome b subunit